MPNHTICLIKFSYDGDCGERITQIKEALKGHPYALSFKGILPEPEDLQDKDTNTLSDTLEEWRIRNWGVDRDAYDVDVLSEASYKLVIRFKTAWDAPKRFIFKLFELFPDVVIKFVAADDGGWFAFHIVRNPSEKKEFVKHWGNDSTRDAIFEALNHSY